MPADRTRITSALQGIERALPQAPEGWRQVNAAPQRPAVPAGAPPSGAHAVSVYVTAGREHLAELVQQIDYGKDAAIVR